MIKSIFRNIWLMRWRSVKWFKRLKFFWRIVIRLLIILLHLWNWRSWLRNWRNCRYIIWFNWKWLIVNILLWCLHFIIINICLSWRIFKNNRVVYLMWKLSLLFIFCNLIILMIIDYLCLLVLIEKNRWSKCFIYLWYLWIFKNQFSSTSYWRRSNWWSWIWSCL